MEDCTAPPCHKFPCLTSNAVSLSMQRVGLATVVTLGVLSEFKSGEGPLPERGEKKRPKPWWPVVDESEDENRLGRAMRARRLRHPTVWRCPSRSFRYRSWHTCHFGHPRLSSTPDFSSFAIRSLILPIASQRAHWASVHRPRQRLQVHSCCLADHLSSLPLSLLIRFAPANLFCHVLLCPVLQQAAPRSFL
jgi:hypothetical protein